MKFPTTLAFAAVLIGARLLAGAPAVWAGVGDKVTGGAEMITAGGVIFSITANAVQTTK